MKLILDWTGLEKILLFPKTTEELICRTDDDVVVQDGGVCTKAPMQYVSSRSYNSCSPYYQPTSTKILKKNYRRINL